mgnify:CR=1 FL=1
MIFLAAGSLLFFGLLCFWVSLDRLSYLDGEAEIPEPTPEPQTEKEEKPRLTRLGRPIEPIRIRA